MNKEDQIEHLRESGIDFKFRQKDWVKKLEEATGKRVEPRRYTKPQETTGDSLALAFRCSTTGRDFTVIFDRESTKDPYKVVKTLTDDLPSSGSSTPVTTPKTTTIDMSSLDSSGVKCPYCDGGDWRFIKCGTCGKLSCAGGPKEPDGRYLHKCPWCGTEGYITGEIERVDGAIVDKPKEKLESKKREQLTRGNSQRKSEHPPLQSRSNPT